MFATATDHTTVSHLIQIKEASIMNGRTAVLNQRAGLGWQIGLWISQILLAGLYGLAGFIKTTIPPAQLVPMGLNYATEFPHWLLLFIGFAELAGAVGILLPALTRIMPSLTPLAALGLATIQVLAIGFHISRGELNVLPMNLALLGLAVFVLWGRVKKAPIARRS
ncbi:MULTISPECIES: DoxX family protein [Bradyrhizobium]|jgi:hypothetical protein|uniref:DoxX family protein n=1 Tax=Bradyrhizobium TaxID=374 RepID=UPI0028938024|nr:DoxX family protein [Bradyrhizobium denitrificans]